MPTSKHLPKPIVSRIRVFRTILIGALSAGTMMVGGISSAVAFDGVIDETMRTINCIGLLITDTELHVVECGVGDTSSSGTLAPIIFAPPAPLVCSESQTIEDDECVNPPPNES